VAGVAHEPADGLRPVVRAHVPDQLAHFRPRHGIEVVAQAAAAQVDDAVVDLVGRIARPASKLRLGPLEFAEAAGAAQIVEVCRVLQALLVLTGSVASQFAVLRIPWADHLCSDHSVLPVPPPVGPEAGNANT